ncbi:MAG: glycosyltransferase family 39 protein [Chloroflexi bacterium]|nr:glycosyltransferase family 39 protein [Chloroflexota bacterium]
MQPGIDLATASPSLLQQSASRRSLPLQDLSLLGAILLLYGGLALYQLGLPGLYYDEAADAVPAMLLLQGKQPELVRGAGLSVLGVILPLMVMDYVGAVHTYAVLPFFAWLGVGVIPLRLMTVTGGALTLLATYVWARGLFSTSWVAAAAALALATHPSFIFYVRQGVHVSSLLALWAMLSLLLLLAWRRSGAWGWAVGAAFVLGLGLSTKVLFLWFILALAAISVAWRGALWLAELRQGHAATRPAPVALASRALRIASAFLAFLAGAGMLILYNLQTGGTLEALAASAQVSQYGVRNSEYLRNLLTRLDSLRALLDGGHFWFLGDAPSNPWFPLGFGLTVAALVATLLLRPQARRHLPGALLALALALLVLLQSPLTLSGLWPTHLFFLLPLLCVLLALGIYLLGRYLLGARGLRAMTATLAFLVTGNLVVDWQYHDLLGRAGGLGAHSDTVAALADFLDTQRVTEPLAMDWGIKYSVQLLTQGRVNPVEVFHYTQEPPEAFLHWLYGALTRPDHLYLFHSPEHTTFPRFTLFKQVAAALQKELRVEATFYSRDGAPVYLLYTAR